MNGLPVNPTQQLEQVQTWSEKLDQRGLVSKMVGQKLKDMILQSRGERLDVIDDPLLVTMLCGPTAVGKSSLINAIADAEISQPGLGATTAAAVIYIHERDDPSRLFEYSEMLGQLGRDAASVVRHRHDTLLHKVLIDTPDIDSVVLRHRAVTEALLHCADIVLFVASPEKYKNMHSARWVAEQRQQRAMGFVLNKWDRPSIGLQYDQKEEVARDFHAVVSAAGFADPLIFKTSTLKQSEAGYAESEISLMKSWLSDALDKAAQKSIQDRRRRAAWGRLGAAISAAVSELFENHPYSEKALARLTETRLQAYALVKADAQTLALVTPGRRKMPIHQSVLNGWNRVTTNTSAIISPIRKIVAWLHALRDSKAKASTQDDGSPAERAQDRFGKSIRVLAAQTIAALQSGSEAAGLPLGTTPSQWESITRRLDEQYMALPARLESELVVEDARPSLRRWVGSAVLFGLEALLALTLVLAIIRLWIGFIIGKYVQGAMLLDTFALMVALIFASELTSEVFFPSLQDRLRRLNALQGAALVGDAWDQLQAALTAQLDAIAELKRQGTEFLSGIDRIVQSVMAPAAENIGVVNRLFVISPQESASTALPARSENGEDKEISFRRQPMFD